MPLFVKPVGNMKREDAFSGTQDLTGEIRVPPDMVDIYLRGGSLALYCSGDGTGDVTTPEELRDELPLI